VLGIEMSRLARSNKDWHQLLELCAIFRTLLADGDGVYDPTDYNDRLLLGLKGTMSEAELHILKSRLYEAWWNKAERGEMLNHPPIGYIRTPGGDYVMDPDEQVQQVVRLIFEQFSRRGSVNALLRYLVRHQIQVPVRPHFGPNRGELEWRRPNRVTLLSMLHHPIYAGAYRWGHREVDPRKKVPGKRSSGRTSKNYDACRVLIADRFPAYLTWHEFLENQRRLAENRSRAEALGAPRHGPSMLSGLVVCGRCDAGMLVGYGGTNKLRYSCQRAAIDYGEPKCISLSGECLEVFVAERILKVVEPASLELSLRASDDLEAERKQLDIHWQQRLERARYEAERAFRQYRAVEPEHRLVARQLERGWEEALRAKEQLEEEYARFQQTCPSRLDDEEREAILSLSRDLPALWSAATTTSQDRQEIARLLLDRVVVNIEGDSDRVDVTLHWAGGFVSRHVVIRPVDRYEQLSNYHELLERIGVLRGEGHSLGDIAECLNEEGFRPPKRTQTFTAAMLSRLLRERGRRVGPRPRGMEEANPLEVNEWWLSDLAHHLQMPIATLQRWRKVSWVHARKLPIAGGRWALWADDEELDRLRRLRVHPRGWPDEPYPKELTTPKPRKNG
jgi:hypothetical protein